MAHKNWAYADAMPPSGHPIADARLEELRRLYKEAYGKELTLEEAREMGQRLLALYRLLMQPYPGETGAPAAGSSAQKSPEAS